MLFSVVDDILYISDTREGKFMETSSISGLPGTTPSGALETVREYSAQIRERSTEDAVSQNAVQNQVQDESRGSNIDIKA